MIVLRVNGRDFAPYARPWAEDGFSMDPEAIGDPQFAGDAAISEGLTFTQEANGNRHWEIPLILDADNRAAFHSLIRDINGDLIQGADVEFASDAADDITHFELETGRLDVTYDFMLTGVHSTARATLHLWSKPFGHTATARLLASVVGTGPVVFQATGILGDVHAMTRMEFGPASAVDSPDWVIAAVHRNPSYNPVVPAASVLATTGNTLDPDAMLATVIGASGRIGSQYAAVNPAVVGGDLEGLWHARLSPTAQSGRLRAYAPFRHRANPATAISLRAYRVDTSGDDVAAPTDFLTPSQIANLGFKWGVYDLGEITVPSVASGGPTPSAVLGVAIGVASAVPSFSGSPAYQLDAIVLVPIDESAAFVNKWENEVGPTTIGSTITRLDGLSRPGAYVGIGSALSAEREGRTRGGALELPPVGSGGSASPVSVFTWQAQIGKAGGGDFVGNRQHRTSLWARERFRFLR